MKQFSTALNTTWCCLIVFTFFDKNHFRLTRELKMRQLQVIFSA
jgi:hypothetical protein